MNKILTIAKKEWRNYFSSPLGYVFAALLLLVSSWMFFGDLFLLGQANIGPYLTTMVFLFSIFIPAISMGLLADEKKNNNWEVILSLPIDETKLVLGKLLGCGMYLLFTIALSLPVAITMLILGQPDIGVIAGGYLGLIMLGGSYLTVGILASSLSNQAIVGFLGATVFLIFDNMLGQQVVLSRLPGVFKNIASAISLASRSGNFNDGVITLNDTVFFISWMAVFTILTVLSLKNRNK
jgi:ABC-2 type transport system permease protein